MSVLNYDILLDNIKDTFIGIGGSGMCPLTEILNNEGYQLSGSDMNEARHSTESKATAFPYIWDIVQRTLTVQSLLYILPLSKKITRKEKQLLNRVFLALKKRYAQRRNKKMKKLRFRYSRQDHNHSHVYAFTGTYRQRFLTHRQLSAANFRLSAATVM